MKKTISISFLFYYLMGTFLLPMGDFSVLPSLPSMYKDCKAKEDKDMTPFDFITDHLLNIDGMFDKHKNGDQQKPHKSTGFTFSNHITQILQHVSYPIFKKNHQVIEDVILLTNYKKVQYSYCYSSTLLRPPIFS